MYRAFHAPIRTTEGTPLRDAQGRPTNAVYIFVTMLRKLLKEHQPEFIAASFDLPGRTFRDDLAADYKANRRPMPEDLAQQIPLVHDACEALGVPILTSERYEADDVIGTLAEQAAAAGFEVAIVTGDKDFFQLVGNGIKVFNPKEDGAWFDANAVKEKFGVAPEQVVDVLALMGDTIDNIKGVPGIGEKGARDLIAEYGSLEALLARAADIPQKRYREPLLAHQESATAEQGARAHQDGRARHVQRRRGAIPRGVAAARVRAVLAARLPIARRGVRADGGDERQGLSPRDRLRAAGARGGAEGGGARRAARDSRRHGRDARAHRRDRVLDRRSARRDTCRLATTPSGRQATSRSSASRRRWGRCWPTRP